MQEMRKLIALIILVYSSYTDIKEKSIYVLQITIGAILGIALSLIEYFFLHNHSNHHYWLNMFFLPILIFLIIYMIASFTNELIGKGDAILIFYICLIIGTAMSLRILFSSIILSGIYSFILIISGKCTSSYEIAFAPFLLAGFLFILL